jgi:hypothetical protein
VKLPTKKNGKGGRKETISMTTGNTVFYHKEDWILTQQGG